MEMILAIFQLLQQQQMVPMLVPIFILRHLILKRLLNHRLLIIFKPFSDLSMTRHQLSIM